MVRTIKVNVAGLGLIFYSPFAVADIAVGDDYLSREFWDPDAVERQAMQGRLVGVALGTPGRFFLRLHDGYPDADQLARHEFKLRLGLEVRDGVLCIRDLYDLMRWNPVCPPEQCIELADGFWHVSLLSTMPASDVQGDDQVIEIWLQPLTEFPGLRYDGVPTLC